MFTIIRNIKASKWIIASASAIALAMPSVSLAGNNRSVPAGRQEVEHRVVEHREFERHDFERHDFDRHDFDRHDFDRHDFGFRIGFSSDSFRFVIQNEAPPAPLYRTVIERQWVEPVYQTVCENVWVPDQYEDRTVTICVGGKDYSRVERVLVQAGHFEARQTQICVSEGHWIEVQKQVPVVCD